MEEALQHKSQLYHKVYGVRVRRQNVNVKTKSCLLIYGQGFITVYCLNGHQFLNNKMKAFTYKTRLAKK